MEMEMDMNLLNWLEKNATQCKYLILAVKCLKYESIKIKDFLIYIIHSFLLDQTKIADEFLRKIMESKEGMIRELKKPDVNGLYLEILCHMTIFKEYALMVEQPMEEDKYDIDVLNKIKENYKNNKLINEIIDEALKNNKIDDNLGLMNDCCNEYENELKKLQDEIIKKENKSLKEMEVEYEKTKEEIEEEKKMCVLGITFHLIGAEENLEKERNNFIQTTQQKRRDEMIYGHLFKPRMKFLKKEDKNSKWPEKIKKEIENLKPLNFEFKFTQDNLKIIKNN